MSGCRKHNRGFVLVQGGSNSVKRRKRKTAQDRVAGYGVYGNGYFAKHIELNEGTNDAEVTPQFLSVYYPNSVGTYPFAMNNQRSVVGAYMSTDGLMHGFVAAPTF